MASNKELIATAKVLAGELGIELAEGFEKQNNKQLTALVSDLRAKKKDAENVTAADGDQNTGDGESGDGDQNTGDGESGDGDASENTGDDGNNGDAGEAKQEPPAQPKKAKAEKKNQPKGPRIAKGRSITTKRGILQEGDEVAPEDFMRGAEDFDAFVKAGFIEGA